MRTRYQHHERRFLPAVFVVFVLVTCIRVWVGPVPVVKSANGQMVDPGRQRKELVEQARRTNELLEEIKQILTDHTLNVRLRGADNQADAPPKRPGGL